MVKGQQSRKVSYGFLYQNEVVLLNLTKTNNIYILLDIHLTAVLKVVVVYWCQVSSACSA